MLSRLHSLEIALHKSLAPRQVLFASLCLVALGLLFEILRRLGNLKLYVAETIAIGLAAGAIYLLALYLFGGEVIRNFNLAMLLGVVIGTYSSIFIAAPLLGYLGVKREWTGAVAKPDKLAAKPKREGAALKTRP